MTAPVRERADGDRPGTCLGRMAVVIHLTEVVAHGADRAVATASEEVLDQRLCQELLELMYGMGGVDAVRAPDVFGPESVAPASVSASASLSLRPWRRQPRS